MKRAAPEVGLGTLAWYSLLNAVKGCGNIVLDLEAPPPLFFFTHSRLTGDKYLTFGCIWSYFLALILT